MSNLVTLDLPNCTGKQREDFNKRLNGTLLTSQWMKIDKLTTCWETFHSNSDGIISDLKKAKADSGAPKVEYAFLVGGDDYLHQGNI